MTAEILSADSTGGTLGVPSEEDVRAITEEVWNSFIGYEVPLMLVEDTPFTAEWSASVAVEGEWNGLISIELTDRLSRAVVERMLGVPEAEVSEADVADGIGEVVNMVGGNIKGIVPGPSRLSLPVVAAGRVAAGSDLAEVVRLRADWLEEPLLVTVHTSSGREQS